MQCDLNYGSDRGSPFLYLLCMVFSKGLISDSLAVPCFIHRALCCYPWTHANGRFQWYVLIVCTVCFAHFCENGFMISFCLHLFHSLWIYLATWLSSHLCCFLVPLLLLNLLWFNFCIYFVTGAFCCYPWYTSMLTEGSRGSKSRACRMHSLLFVIKMENDRSFQVYFY